MAGVGGRRARGTCHSRARVVCAKHWATSSVRQAATSNGCNGCNGCNASQAATCTDASAGGSSSNGRGEPAAGSAAAASGVAVAVAASALDPPDVDALLLLLGLLISSHRVPKAESDSASVASVRASEGSTREACARPRWGVVALALTPPSRGTRCGNAGGGSCAR